MDCFEKMQHEGMLSNEVTCVAIGAIDRGKKFHDVMLRQGLLEHHIMLGGALVDMYAKCGDLCQERSVLEKVSFRDVVCWNTLIAGYAQSGQGQQARDCFEQISP